MFVPVYLVVQFLFIVLWFSFVISLLYVVLKVRMSFYRATLCIRGTSHGPVSVCLSVTSRCSIETAERIELVFGT